MECCKVFSCKYQITNIYLFREYCQVAAFLFFTSTISSTILEVARKISKIFGLWKFEKVKLMSSGNFNFILMSYSNWKKVTLSRKNLLSYLQSIGPFLIMYYSVFDVEALTKNTVTVHTCCQTKRPAKPKSCFTNFYNNMALHIYSRLSIL